MDELPCGSLRFGRGGIRATCIRQMLTQARLREMRRLHQSHGLLSSVSGAPQPSCQRLYRTQLLPSSLPAWESDHLSVEFDLGRWHWKRGRIAYWHLCSSFAGVSSRCINAARYRWDEEVDSLDGRRLEFCQRIGVRDDDAALFVVCFDDSVPVAPVEMGSVHSSR